MTSGNNNGRRLYQLIQVLVIVSPVLADGRFVEEIRLKINDNTCTGNGIQTAGERTRQAKETMNLSWRNQVRYEVNDTDGKGRQFECRNVGAVRQKCDVEMSAGDCQTLRRDVGLVVCNTNPNVSAVAILVNGRPTYSRITSNASADCSDVTRITAQLTSYGTVYDTTTCGFSVSNAPLHMTEVGGAIYTSSRVYCWYTINENWYRTFRGEKVNFDIRCRCGIYLPAYDRHLWYYCNCLKNEASVMLYKLYNNYNNN